MGDDAVNMSLDEIIKQNKQQNRASRSRGRGGGTSRGRGGGTGVGGGRGGNRGRANGRGRGGGRGRQQSRAGTPGPRQSRSRSRGPRNRSQSQGRSQSQARSRSRQRSQSGGRSRSRSQLRGIRGLTPRGRAGLEEPEDVPQLVGRNRFYRGGPRNRLQRSNSNPNLQGNVHSRLGVQTRRGAANLRRPFVKRGVQKRGRGMNTGNNYRYSNIGLRSDQILKQQRQNMLLYNNIIKSQTFTRSRNNSFSTPSQLTVKINNDFQRKRRNSIGNAGYLDRQSLANLNNTYGGYNKGRGPGSVRSMGSNRSNRSDRSNRSNRSTQSNRSNGSVRSRGRGRGRGGYRGVGRKFVNKQILNPQLQEEIAAIQHKTYGAESEPPAGVSITFTPMATSQTLHQRFAST